MKLTSPSSIITHSGVSLLYKAVIPILSVRKLLHFKHAVRPTVTNFLVRNDSDSVLLTTV